MVSFRVETFGDKKPQFFVQFSGENFFELLEEARRIRLTYQPSTKDWKGDISQAHEFALCSRELGENVSDKLIHDFLPSPEVRRVRRRLDESLLPTPPLADYQLTETKRAFRSSRFYFAWEQGLGKTWGLAVTLNHLMNDEVIDKILVVCPPESVYNIRRNLIRMSTHGLTKDDFFILNPNNRDPLQSNAKIAISTYRGFLLWTDDYKMKKKKSGKMLRKPVIPFETWGTSRVLVLDEAHKAKNPKARVTNSLMVHSPYFDYRYMLSGTPAPNGVKDWYSQLKILDPGIIPFSYSYWHSSLLKNRISFSTDADNENPYDPERVSNFMNHIRPWVSRVFTSGNLDLPEKNIKRIYIGSDTKSKHLQMYRAVVKNVLTRIREENGELVPTEVWNKFPYISQALSDPSLFKDKLIAPSDEFRELVKNWKFENNEKLQYCDMLVTDLLEQGKKVIIWSGHPATMDSLAEHYQKYAPIVIHGQNKLPKGRTKNEWRQERLDTYRSSEEHNLLIASYKVLSTAVDIVEATENIYFDRSWDLTDWLQSQKRTHRAGQTENVTIYLLIYEDTLDELLDARLTKKESFDRHMFNRESLSKEEWESIFDGKLKI